MNHLKSQFLLDPAVIFLNHGSFGATPRPVFETYQAWQLRMERQPVRFIINELPKHLADARRVLGSYLNAGQDDVVYVPNATFGLNVIARSLDLQPGDEVLTTDHEYGACDNVWRFLARKKGFTYRKQPIPLPATTAAAIVEQLWQGVTPQTRVIFISHISSSTALCFPASEICQRARAAGILTIVDGAHAPGQIPLDLTAMAADFYFGNAHKWMCSPKGAAFLFARPERQHLLEPLVVGWGWGDERAFTFGSDFLDYQQWLGTNDVSAYLSVPAAIAFQEEHNWTAVGTQCHTLLARAVGAICDLTGLPSIYPDDADFYFQMATIPLPPLADREAFKAQLYDRYRIEAPLVEWNGRFFIRISVQGYNSQADLDTLIHALQQLL